jgi:hypothetical protein
MIKIFLPLITLLFINPIWASQNAAKILYSTLVGSSDYDVANDVAVDSKRNFYVVGYSVAEDDAFVRKFNPSGKLIWTKFIGGSGSDSADTLAVTPGGICYVAGTTNSSNFPTVGGFQTRYGGGPDAFVAKLDPNGSIIQSSFLGGSGFEKVSGIQLGTGANHGEGVYIFGKTNSRNFTRKNAAQSNYGGGQQDGFLAIVHSTTFQLLMSTYVGRKGDEELYSLEFDTAKADLYVSGQSTGSLEERFFAHFVPANSNRAGDASIPNLPYKIKWAKIQLPMTTIYIAYKVWPMVLRKSINSGTNSNTSVDSVFTLAMAGACVPQAPSTTCNDIGLLAFYDQNLNLLRTVNFGGLTGLYLNDMTIARNGSIIVAGETLSEALTAVNAFQATNKGGWEGWVMSFSPDGNQIKMSSYVGGEGSEFVRAITTDNAGNVYFVGQTSSKKFPITPNAAKKTLTGTADGFVVKIKP